MSLEPGGLGPGGFQLSGCQVGCPPGLGGHCPAVYARADTYRYYLPSSNSLVAKLLVCATLGRPMTMGAPGAEGQLIKTAAGSAHFVSHA